MHLFYIYVFFCGDLYRGLLYILLYVMDLFSIRHSVMSFSTIIMMAHFSDSSGGVLEK